MSTFAEKLEIVLSAHDKNLTSTIDKVGKSIVRMGGLSDDFGSRIDKAFSRGAIAARNFNNTLTAVHRGALALRGLLTEPVMSMLNTSGEFERMEKLLEGVSDAADETGKRLDALSGKKFLVDMAKNAPFEISALQDAFVKLKVGGVDPMNGSLQALVDSIAAFGGSSDILKRAAIAIQQMGGKGVVSMEELRQQLGEGVPTAMKAMAFSMGVTLGELVDKVSTGTVESQQAVTLMLDQLGKENAGAAENLMNTWSGVTARLKTEWRLFQDEVARGGAMDAAKESVKALSDIFANENFKNTLTSVTNSFSAFVGVAADATRLLAEHADVVVKVAEGYALLKGAKWLSSIGNENGEARSRDAFFGTTGVVDSYRQKIEEAKQAQIDAAVETANGVIAANQQSQVSMEQELAKLRETSAQKTLIYQQNFVEYEIAAQRYIEIEQQKNVRLSELAAQELQIQTRLDEARNRRTTLMSQGGYSAEVAKIEGVIKALEKESLALVKERNEIVANAQTYRSYLDVLEAGIRTMQLDEEERQRLIASLERQKAEIDSLITKQQQEIETTEQGSRAIDEQAGKVGVLTKLKAAWTTACEFLNGKIASLGEFLRNAWGAMKDMIGSMITGIAQMALMTAAAYALSYAWDTVANAIRRATNEQLYFENTRRKIEAGKASEKEVNRLRGENAELGRQLRQGGEWIQNVDGSETFIKHDAAKMKELNDLYEKNKVSLRVHESNVKESETSANISGLMRGARNINKDYDGRIADITRKYRKLGETGGDPKAALEQQKKEVAALNEQRASELAGIKNQIKGYADQGGAFSGMYSLAYQNFDKDSKGSGVVGADAIPSGIPSISGKGKGAKGKSGSKKNKGGKFQKDTYSDFITAATSEVAKLQAETDAFMKSAIDYEDIEKKAEAVVLGKISDGRNGKKAWSKEQIRRATELQVALLKAKDANELLKKSSNDLVQSQAELKTVNMETEEGFTSLPSSIQTLEKEYAKLQRKTASLSAEQLRAFKIQKAQVVMNKLATESIKERLDAEEKTKELQSSYISDTVDRRVYDINNSISEVRKEMLASLKEWQKEFNEGDFQQGTKEFEEAMKRRQDIIDGFGAKMNLTIEQALLNNTTAMQQLESKWADVTGNMESASTSWASSFTDNLQTVIEGGSADWRGFLRGMLSDMNKVLIQKAFGGFITNTFGQIGGFAGEIINTVAGNSVAGANAPTKTELMNVYAGAVNFSGAYDVPGIAQNINLPSVNDAIDKATGELKDMSSAVGNVDSVIRTGADNFAIQMQNWGSVISDTALETKWSFKGMMDDMSVGASNFLSSIGQYASQGFAAVGSWFGFANGGIMTGKGALPLKAYAGGGIATSPQLAVFGEGSRPEAFVPLPDGRSIPVTLTGNRGAGGSYTPVSIQINVDNNGAGSQTTSGGAGDSGQNQMWSELAQKIKGMVVEEINTQKRPGGVLY